MSTFFDFADKIWELKAQQSQALYNLYGMHSRILNHNPEPKTSKPNTHGTISRIRRNER